MKGAERKGRAADDRQQPAHGRNQAEPEPSAHAPTGNSAATGPRAECLRLIERAVGPGGMRAFLAARQPELDDETGAWLLQHEPERLLRRLKTLAATTADDWVDDIPEPTARRKEGAGNRVLSILDGLETEGGR